MRFRRAAAIATVIVSVIGLLVGFSSSASAASKLPMAPAATGTASFSGHGSTEEAYALGAKPGEKMMLVNGSGRIVGSGVADSLGGFLVPNVPAGSGYTIRAAEGKQVVGTKPFTVLSTSYVPPTSLYTSQHLHAGMNYIRMRDGVTLNATVHLPAGKTMADGPFPTVIEYSGYQIAAPDDLLTAIEKSVATGKGLSNSPLLPSTSTAVGSVLTPLLGFATVSVQIRGTGCSGGAFDLFGLPSDYDGYDIVETVAHQPWVKNHKVGMVGISFSGFSQLFVAGTRPPGLAAIAPLSPTNDLYATGYPGGIYNDGFAASWIESRFENAEPAEANAPNNGALPYAVYAVQHGNKQCIANQVLHPETAVIAKDLAEAKYRVPSLYDVRSPEMWAKKIDVPVFIAGAFQDEETGGQWSDMLPDLKSDPDVFANIINGTHIDSINPGIISRWLEFLDIFVADEVPTEPEVATTMGPTLYSAIADASAEPIPPVRFSTAKNAAQARAEFIKDTPRVRVLMDNGGNSTTPGALQPEWEEDFSSWPPPQEQVTREYLGTGGTLSSTKPAASSVAFRPNPAARPSIDLPTGNPWADLPPYDWAPITGSNGVGFITAPLTQDLTVIGPSSLDVWVQSSAADTDLQATISEVRPNGQEMYMTSGVLRASDRKLDTAESTTLLPVPTYLKSNAKSLPKGRYTELQIPITPFAYTFRTGSRIRVTIEAPGGDRPSWAFDTYKTGGKVVDTVSLGGVEASNWVMPVIPNVKPPDAQPACPSLRGQPCRTYVPAGNGG